MESLRCPTCEKTTWTIWGVQFETGGTLVEVTAECTSCGHRLNIGVVNGDDIK